MDNSPAETTPPQPGEAGEPRVRAIGGEWVISRRWAMLALAGLTGLALSLIFEPIGLWPLAYVCLVPWVTGVVCCQRRTWMFLTSYLLGVLFFLFNLHWLWQVTSWPPGGIGFLGARITLPVGTMIVALLLGLYFPLAAWLIRFGYRRARVPLTLAVPVVWVMTEYLRGYLPIVPYDGQWRYTGLPWFYLAHSHYKILPVIQVADVAGAYGVSFLLAMVNGWLADLIVQPILWFSPKLVRWNRKLKWLTAFTVATVAGSLVYGFVQLRIRTLKPGPKVAVIQSDLPLFVDLAGGVLSSPQIVQQQVSLMLQAQQDKPDLIALPETSWPVPLNRELRESLKARPALRKLFELDPAAEHERLKKLASDLAATLAVGSASIEMHPQRPPVYRNDRYNSVLVYSPGQPEPQRYDKIHLVPFGEFIPFRRGRLHWLYNWINRQMPWDFEYSLTAGKAYKVFEAPAPSQGGQVYRFATPICYEITMPQACRAFCYGPAGKRADLLVNLSNDGWFHYKSELPQHLAVAVFRAVENRVGLARSVNTGISALVDPNGRIIKAMRKNGKWRDPAPRGWPLPYKGFTGVLVAEVPTDPKITLYMRWGDWLAEACLILSGLGLVAWWFDRTWLALRHLRRSRQAVQAVSRRTSGQRKRPEKSE